MLWFEAHRPPRGVGVRDVSLERLGFRIAGPRARDVLAAAAPGSDVSNEALRFLDAREVVYLVTRQGGTIRARWDVSSFASAAKKEVGRDAGQHRFLHGVARPAGQPFEGEPFAGGQHDERLVILGVAGHRC